MKNETGTSETSKIDEFCVFFPDIVLEPCSRALPGPPWVFLWPSGCLSGAPGAPGGGFEPLDGGIEAHLLLFQSFSTQGIEPIHWELSPFVVNPIFSTSECAFLCRFSSLLRPLDART